MWSVIGLLSGVIDALFCWLFSALPDLIFYELTGWTDNPPRRRRGAAR